MTDYRDAGVDRDAGEQWLTDMDRQIRSTARSEVLSEIGDFGAFFKAPENYKQPVWVASTDGVGTKLLLAEESGDSAFSGIGIDLVAMCVNDVLACRAEPMVFLDYLATGKLNPHRAKEFLKGVIEGCRQSRCALVGGETAEMPGFYAGQRMDVAGFSIGVLEASQRFRRDHVQKGDWILGFPSSGFHSNGYSLIRKVMSDQSWTLGTRREGELLQDFLLRPTRIYVADLLDVLREEGVRGAAHITGGGLVENLPRAFDNANLKAVIQRSRIPTSDLMKDLMAAARLESREAYSTWNMGIGFCLLATPKVAGEILKSKPEAIHLGEILERKSGERDLDLE